jgi:cystathionine beta-lyase
MNPFGESPDRRGTDSTKWSRYPPDVLPMWVADMDVAVPAPIREALAARIAHPVFGYAAPDQRLLSVIAARLGERHRWTVHPQEVVLLPGVVPGINMAARALVRTGGAIVYHSPAYPPIRQVARHWGLRDAPIPARADAAALRAALAPGDAFILCNPHNPTGHVYTPAEVAALADACLSAGAWIIADEIHCDLLFDRRTHTPIASLSPEVARRTVTLMSPGKAFNIAGLKIGFAVMQDADLRARVLGCRLGMVDSVSGIGMAATLAAFTHCDDWLASLVAALQANRDHLARAVATTLPAVRLTVPHATCLAWLDLRSAGLGPDPAATLLERGRIGLNPGADFGAAGFARLNFGCPRATLDDGIARIAACLAA